MTKNTKNNKKKKKTQKYAKKKYLLHDELACLEDFRLERVRNLDPLVGIHGLEQIDLHEELLIFLAFPDCRILDDVVEALAIEREADADSLRLD